MATTVDPIKITGLRDLQAALKELDGESQKMLRTTLNEVAETVAAGARRRVPVKTGKARASIKAASSQREARVKGGGAKASYYPWLEFGGKVGPKRSVKRPYVNGGRYIYATYAANRDGIMKGLDEAVGKLIDRAGLDGG